MAVFSKEFLTGSADGTPVALSATSNTTTLHTVPNLTPDVVDEVWLWVSNYSSATRTVTIEFGSTTSTENIDITVAAGTVVLAIPGIPLAETLVVTAFADVANNVSAFGYVNRITD